MRRRGKERCSNPADHKKVVKERSRERALNKTGKLIKRATERENREMEKWAGTELLSGTLLTWITNSLTLSVAVAHGESDDDEEGGGHEAEEEGEGNSHGEKRRKKDTKERQKRRKSRLSHEEEREEEDRGQSLSYSQSQPSYATSR